MANTQSLIPPNIDYSKISADKYSPDETYKAGRLIIHNNALCKAKQDINVAEAWTPEHWEPTTLAAELSAVNSRMDSRLQIYVLSKYISSKTNFTVKLPTLEYGSSAARQTVLIFGNINGKILFGVLRVRGDGNVLWYGTPESGITASFDSSGVLTVNVGDYSMYDTITIISGDPISDLQ